ncbi:hypothetical protein AML29_03875 [Escherichia coli]|nr:hypothetical protein AML29_03875 [Escherichia coli]OYC64221.1 hypothetical protein RX35_04996 [Escherichia coli]
MYYNNFLYLQETLKSTTVPFSLIDFFNSKKHISENSQVNLIEMVTSLMNTGPPRWLSYIKISPYYGHTFGRS